MLSVPDETVHRTKIADWLELKAISSPDGRVGFGTLVSATALAENEPRVNIGDEDRAEEQFVLRVQVEIGRRLNNVGDDYPFRIDDKGRALQFVTPVSEGGSVYLFCLFLSHAFDRTIVPKKLAPKITNAVRDLFQACATVAAGGYVKGPSMSFGFPRPDGTTFLKALHRVYQLFGDGKPRKHPRPAAARNIKDNGIDIIAWRRSVDNLPCTLYLIAQVASGANWEGKSVVSDRQHFHKYWFENVPDRSLTTRCLFRSDWSLRTLRTAQRMTRCLKTTCRAWRTDMGLCSIETGLPDIWSMAYSSLLMARLISNVVLISIRS